jgi:GNAT superfamily N-acetyltransferase
MNPASEIIFRAATTRDLQQIGDLRWRLKTEDANDSSPLARDTFITAFVKDQTQSTAFLHWVAEANGGLIAVMSLARVPKLLAPHQHPSVFGYLTNCYTLPSFRGCGVGKHLLGIIIDWARQQDFELLLVWPSDESYDFYGRCGFKDLRDPLVLPLENG